MTCLIHRNLDRPYITIDVDLGMNKYDTSLTCICILMMAFPIRVAPKNVQNGTRKCPHVMPAKSNSGLGICQSQQRDIKTFIGACVAQR